MIFMHIEYNAVNDSSCCKIHSDIVDSLGVAIDSFITVITGDKAWESKTRYPLTETQQWKAGGVFRFVLSME